MPTPVLAVPLANPRASCWPPRASFWPPQCLGRTRCRGPEALEGNIGGGRRQAESLRGLRGHSICLQKLSTLPTNDPGTTQTCHPRLRGPMPYPLGHGASCAIAGTLSRTTHCVSKHCRSPGSNRGPSDLQSDALPAELSRLVTHQNLEHVFALRISLLVKTKPVTTLRCVAMYCVVLWFIVLHCIVIA